MKTMYFIRTVVLATAVLFFSSCAFLDIFLSPPLNENYTVLADYGLMVMKKDIGKSTKSGGDDMCKQIRLGGFSDWRLPTQGELAILYNERNKTGGFTNTRYWSSTPHQQVGGGFFVCIDFSDGKMGYHLDMFNQQPLAVRCIRSAYP